MTWSPLTMGFIGAKGEETFVNFHRTSFKVCLIHTDLLALCVTFLSSRRQTVFPPHCHNVLIPLLFFFLPSGRLLPSPSAVRRCALQKKFSVSWQEDDSAATKEVRLSAYFGFRVSCLSMGAQIWWRSTRLSDASASGWLLPADDCLTHVNDDSIVSAPHGFSTAELAVDLSTQGHTRGDAEDQRQTS
jgi:hypothetical protein